jgi:hypothetical protein
MLCDELGKLLITLVNATATVFGDDAIVSKITPSGTYDEDGVILDITITYRDYNYTEEELEILLQLLDNFIYNPIVTPDWILNRVRLEVVPIG